jgi:hypothetical protein
VLLLQRAICPGDNLDAASPYKRPFMLGSYQTPTYAYTAVSPLFHCCF